MGTVHVNKSQNLQVLLREVTNMDHTPLIGPLYVLCKFRNCLPDIHQSAEHANIIMTESNSTNMF